LKVHRRDGASTLRYHEASIDVRRCLYRAHEKVEIQEKSIRAEVGTEQEMMQRMERREQGSSELNTHCQLSRRPAVGFIL
jgi:hypothetical protein